MLVPNIKYFRFSFADIVKIITITAGWCRALEHCEWCGKNKGHHLWSPNL